VDRIPHLRRWIVGAVIGVVLVVATGASARAENIVVLRIKTNGVVTGTDHLRCSGRCWIPFTRGTLVALHAAAPRHFEFDGWSGGCLGESPTCVVSLDESVTIRAPFVGESTDVSLSVGGPGSIVSNPKGISCGGGHSSCDAEFPWGTRLTLSTRPAAVGRFASWGAACWNVGHGSCTLRLGGDETDVTAAFRHADPATGLQTLTAVGYATSKPAGIHCPGVCTASFPSGTRVHLEAPGAWSGACVSSSLGRCLLVLDAPASVVGTLPQPHSSPSQRGYGVRVSVSGRGAVKAPGINCDGVSGKFSDCQSLFLPNTDVTFNAKAARNGRFLGWGEFCKNWGLKPVCKLSIFTPMLVGATFKL
jgi:hypothetical protein